VLNRKVETCISFPKYHIGDPELYFHPIVWHKLLFSTTHTHTPQRPKFLLHDATLLTQAHIKFHKSLKFKNTPRYNFQS